MLFWGRVLVIGIFAMLATAADNALAPLTVCEVLKDIPTQDGKVVAVLGRFSFRRDGRTLNEESCGTNPEAGAPPPANSIRLTDDTKTGPKPPDVFALDATALNRKLKAVQEHTKLRNFRFGTADYDRWAVVYGRIESDKAKTPAARLVYRGDGVILFLHEN